jgi:hypothetical protein
MILVKSWTFHEWRLISNIMDFSEMAFPKEIHQLYIIDWHCRVYCLRSSFFLESDKIVNNPPQRQGYHQSIIRRMERRITSERNGTRVFCMSWMIMWTLWWWWRNSEHIFLNVSFRLLIHFILIRRLPVAMALPENQMNFNHFRYRRFRFEFFTISKLIEFHCQIVNFFWRKLLLFS